MTPVRTRALLIVLAAVAVLAAACADGESDTGTAAAEPLLTDQASFTAPQIDGGEYEVFVGALGLEALTERMQDLAAT